MIKFIKKNLDIIVTVLILIIIISLNIQPDKIIMGLDNSSPFFQPFEIFKRIKGTSSIIYGGLIFQLPFLGSLSKLGIGPELLSNIFVFSNLITGTLGISFLLKRSFKRTSIIILGVIIFLTNLFLFWIFGNPNFLFIVSFGTIPIIIYLLSSKNLTWFHWLLLSIFSISFLTTTLNIVAFTLYLLCIICLSLIFNKNKKSLYKRLSMWIIALLIFWFGSIQIIMVNNQDKTFFPIQIYEYTQELIDNPYVTSNTEGIIASKRTNTLIRTMSFALGWMELHDSNDIPIFENYTLYRENLLYIILGTIPFLLAILAVFLEPNKKTILLTISLISFVLISSKYGISIIEKIPYIQSSLRWISSKLWPLFIIPLIILSTTTLNELTKNKSTLIKFLSLSLILVILCIYGSPILNKHLLAPKTLVNIPSEYFEIPNDSSILILPIPQRSYMREYDWGYYGSDFLVHITNSEIIDGANLFEYGERYSDILTNENISVDIDYVIYNTSAEINLPDELKDKSQLLLNGLKLISSNEYFTIYER